MDVKLDPVLGDIRQVDGKIMREQSPGGESDVGAVAVIRGGERIVLTTPLKELTVEEVENSPFESELIFSTTYNFTQASKVRCGLHTDWDGVEVTLTQDDPAAVGNARTFSASFYDDDPDWNGYGQWNITASVDPETGKWTVSSEYSGTHWDETPDGDWEEVPYSVDGVFAVAKEADVELEFVEWTDFNYDRIPKGNAVREGVFAEIDGGASPPMISIPASVGVIGALPVFDAGKQYILNFRDGLVVGAEVRR